LRAGARASGAFVERGSDTSVPTPVPELRDWVEALPPGVGEQARSALRSGLESRDRDLLRAVGKLQSSFDAMDEPVGAVAPAEALALERLVEVGYAKFLAMCRADATESLTAGASAICSGVLAGARAWRGHPAQAALDTHTHIAVFEPVLRDEFGVSALGYVRRLALCVPNASLPSVVHCLAWAVLDRHKGHVFVEDTEESRLFINGDDVPDFSVMPRGTCVSATGLFEKKLAEAFLFHVGVPFVRGCDACEYGA